MLQLGATEKKKVFGVISCQKGVNEGVASTTTIIGCLLACSRRDYPLLSLQHCSEESW